MKYLSTTVLFIFYCSIVSKAQYPCFNGISTNPLNPINNQLPAKRNTFFNWHDSLWSMQPLSFCFRSSLNESPFYKIDNLEELRESKDMKWDDGWELIRRFVGLTETNVHTISNPEHLYIILYNKYTGILRVILLVCRGADYNAARIGIKFDGTSLMKTDLLEFSRDQVSALDKTYSLTEFAAGVKYVNENMKYLYADFPMMYDPCTCMYKSKLNIISQLISNATINIEGGITGEIHTTDAGGKAQVQKPGTFSWKGFTGAVNGKVTTVHGAIDKFRTATQALAENIGRTDTFGKKNAIAQFATLLKDNKFLKAGLNAVPWLKSALSVIDVFSGGGKTTSGTQEVKLLPLSVNLTAKLSGTLTTVNQYHDAKFSNPGSKDAHLDPDVYPYYNEVLGIFNLLKTPRLYVQSNSRYDSDDESGLTIHVKENRYRFDLTTFKYVLNPAAGVTIQNMKAAILIEGTNRNYPVCQFASGRVIPPDFEFEGKDAITGAEKFSSNYFDMTCLGSRVLQANSYFNTIAAASASYPLYDVGCPMAGTSKAYLKIMLNLKRNNATGTTQNIMYLVTYPLTIVSDPSLPTYNSNYGCNDSSIVAAATPAEVVAHCSSAVYNSTGRNSRVARSNEVQEPENANMAISVLPNPNNGQFTIRFKNRVGALHSIRITDISGREVYTAACPAVSLQNGYYKTFNITLTPGMYLVQAFTDKELLKTKMIVQ